jgi:hypothetical protein
VRRIIPLAAVGLIAWWGLSAQAGGKAAASKKKPAEPTCTGEHGTNLHFEKSPSDAARKALKEEKLVFVLHISGNFENPDET